jgi:hypothetical protein
MDIGALLQIFGRCISIAKHNDDAHDDDDDVHVGDDDDDDDGNNGAVDVADIRD